MRVLSAIVLLSFTSLHAMGQEMDDWPFDQGRNVAAITTRQVVHEGLPVLMVVHYADDHSWAFICGTTNESDDAMLISMEQALSRDPSLASIADLPPGWTATRDTVESDWVRTKDE